MAVKKAENWRALLKDAVDRDAKAAEKAKKAAAEGKDAPARYEDDEAPALVDLERAWKFIDAVNLGYSEALTENLTRHWGCEDDEVPDRLEAMLEPSGDMREALQDENVLLAIARAVQIGMYPPPEVLLEFERRLRRCVEQDLELEHALVEPITTGGTFAKRQRRQERDFRLAMEINGHIQRGLGPTKAATRVIVRRELDESPAALLSRLRRQKHTRNWVMKKKRTN